MSGSPLPERDRTAMRIPALLIGDRSLSFRARGVLLWLLAEQNPNVSSEGIVAAGTEDQESIHEALAELAAAGYIRRERRAHLDGRLSAALSVSTDPVRSWARHYREARSEAGGWVFLTEQADGTWQMERRRSTGPDRVEERSGPVTTGQKRHKTTRTLLLAEGRFLGPRSSVGSPDAPALNDRPTNDLATAAPPVKLVPSPASGGRPFPAQPGSAPEPVDPAGTASPTLPGTPEQETSMIATTLALAWWHRCSDVDRPDTLDALVMLLARFLGRGCLPTELMRSLAAIGAPLPTVTALTESLLAHRKARGLPVSDLLLHPPVAADPGAAGARPGRPYLTLVPDA